MTTKSDPYGGDVLPSDPSLDAFAALADKATKTKARKAPRPEDAGKEPAKADEAAGEPGLRVVTTAARKPAPAGSATTSVVTVKHSTVTEGEGENVDVAVGEVVISIPDLGKAGARSTQGLVMVSSDVRDRIARYQAVKKEEMGSEPTNAVVIRRAFLAARKADKFAELLRALRTRHQAVEDEDDDPDGLFGHVEGRRPARGRVKNSVQQSFRPSFQELATIDAFAEAYGFPSRSDLIDAVLDDFLPPLAQSGESAKRTPRRRKIKSTSSVQAEAGDDADDQGVVEE